MRAGMAILYSYTICNLQAEKHRHTPSQAHFFPTPRNLREDWGHPTYYLTCKQQGKTRTVYVPQDLLPEVQLWVTEHHRLKQLTQHVSQLALAQIRSHVTEQRRKAGRS